MSESKDGRALGAVKGGLQKSINRMIERKEEVPQAKWDELKAAGDAIAREKDRRRRNKAELKKRLKAGATNSIRPPDDFPQDDESDEAEEGGTPGTPSSIKAAPNSLTQGSVTKASEKPRKRKRTLLEEHLEFEDDKDTLESVPSVLKMAKKGDHYERPIDVPVTIVLPNGECVEILAAQKRSDLDSTFWKVVGQHAASSAKFAPGINASARTEDATGLKVSAAVLPSLLGESGVLRYGTEEERITKQDYKAFLLRLSQNLAKLIAKANKAQISNDNRMTRERVSTDVLLSEEDETKTIPMKDHNALMNGQRKFLLSAVENVREQLVFHGVAISNMAEQAVKRHWETSAMMLALSESVTKKQISMKKSAKEPGGIFDPDVQEFDHLTPLMVRQAGAHQCACPKCKPGFVEAIVNRAEAEAGVAYERKVTMDAQVDIYQAAVEKYRDEAEKAAFEEVQRDLKAEVEKEVVERYEAGLRQQFEKEWAEKKRAEVEAELQEALIAKLRK